MKKKLTDSRRAVMLSSLKKIIVALLLIVTVACSRETSHNAHTYTCSMHPTVIASEPGKCPICAMDLIRIDPNGENHSQLGELSDVLKPTNQQVLTSIKTTKGEYKMVPVKYEAQGIVTYDTRNIFTISSRVSGRIEKTFLKFPYQTISKGQQVAQIHSTELNTAQGELQYLLENDRSNQDLISGAKRKLSLFGMTDAEIARIRPGQPISGTFSIYSPYSGYVVVNNNPPATTLEITPGQNATEGMNGDMNTNNTSAKGTGQPTSTSTLIKEGSYVASGETLFRIVSNSSLRVELDLPATQSGPIKKGNELHMDFGSGIEQVGIVDFVQPFFNKNQDFMKVRVVTSNLHGLHVGHLLRATITSDSIQSMWLPVAAVVDLGKSRIIFIKEKNTFKPKEIQTGIVIKDSIQIMSGLTTNDEVAANAQFLVDSESIIKH